MIAQELRDLMRSMMRHQRPVKVELAAAAGITPSAVSKLIGGKSTIGVDKLEKMAPMRGINPGFLSGVKRNPFKSSKLITLALDESLLSDTDFDILDYVATTA